MSTPLRLAIFAAGVIIVFLLAFGVGRAFGPWSPEPAQTPDPTHGPTHGETHGQAQDHTPTEASDDD